MTSSTSGGTGAAVSWRALLATYLPALILSTGVGIALPAIPALANSFHVSFGVASGVITLFLIGSLAGTIPAGWLVDRFGRRPILIAGPLIIAVAAFSIAQTSSFTVLLALRFISGFAQQMWLISRLAAISHGAVANQRGRQISWMYGMDNIGRLVGPLLGGFIAANLGIRSTFVAYGILALLALVPTMLFSEATPRRAASGETNRVAIMQSLRDIRDIIVPRIAYFGVAFFAGLTRGPFLRRPLSSLRSIRISARPRADRLPRSCRRSNCPSTNIFCRMVTGQRRPNANDDTRVLGGSTIAGRTCRVGVPSSECVLVHRALSARRDHPIIDRRFGANHRCGRVPT